MSGTSQMLIDVAGFAFIAALAAALAACAAQAVAVWLERRRW
jgi:hypothetical protein